MNKKSKLIWSIIIIIITIFYFGNVLYKRTNNPYAKVGTEITWNDLQVADIILIQEHWIVGWVPGYWTHTVIFDGYDETGQGWIVESKYDGIKRKSINTILNDSNEKIILRLNNANFEVQTKIIDYIHEHLGKHFSYYWLSKNENRSDYNYCSELIWKAYKNARYDLDVNPDSVWPYFNGVAPQELYDSPLTNKYYVAE